MKLKEVCFSDMEMVKELFLSVFSQEPWNDDWSDEEQLDCYIGDLLAHPRTLCFGLFDQEKLIGLSLGYIRYWYEGTEYRIEELCIARNYQGRGIGQDFLKRIEEQLIVRNIVHILLQTERTLPAFFFYKKCGFHALEADVTMVKKVGHHGTC
ncbi:GNAT family N-acetyltransferase [Streptococcus suis]|uniref:N-acetyltransferase n=1 Tax=Streptococcus suis TaxID=1307 RepID=A0ACD4UKA9_STRSU|nr:GNAT family N-acetyltransferase [Streptococcus suis]ASW49956.1 GNAT family N-acetyltransferase [Streptococcus suis]NQM46722.1 GNAT family N-acetyltransferase [Streptococcus suis]HEM2811122.1 GNAT family N-acetyltransferase [Streptococcus suis]HEM4289096.1 GNAT family N-acetyltransferase [Streptococcus suis]